MGPISFYLDFKINEKYKKKIIKFSQPAYIDKILFKFYIIQANISNILIKEDLLILNKKKTTIAK